MSALAAYRKSEGLTQTQVIKQLGLRSPGYLSVIERGAAPCPIKLALEIQRWSSGRVSAAALVSADDAELLRLHVQFATGDRPVVGRA